MDHITNEKIEQYIYNLLPESPSILSELEQVAKERHVPIVGPLVGRFLYILARASRAKRVLEIGTAIGYSAIWFGLAIKQHKGTVITVEIDENTANEATRNIARAKLQRTIKVINGSGLQIVPKLKGKFDIVFIDDRKENYPEYLEMCANRLNKNGLLIADNALWSGKVALESKSEDALAIARFNELLAKKMSSVIIPARDGLAIGIK
jgi:predicted O-methyltransferase YrrM